MTRRLPLAAAMLAATALAACSGGSDAPDAPVNDNDNAAVVIDETPVQNLAEPEPTPSPTPTPAPIVEDDRATDEQVQDDADAVGMTARLPRDQGGNETAPAE
ncbi:hypothetical protein CA223_02010 [Sphingomonas koreensis]|jgi:PBP1b-binding outer membrane lipoprotein LpoB|uniref:Uncharacterized protein n=1 Tax=Sphingomonas koreensis TaxID=93064 RepID=A0A1L6JEF8_9SPHN|nr:hypothetical protein [Sphingomonas koreensis]APR54304.1 hypothetical protein BRX40_19480 [Sphingomonas koreensis]MDC7809320.1 hypothetical protein [Sphingomonas koreensis]RSU18488.1 hypothetical protein CA224_15930 [Sphingomonas koreensis]RSU22462.1 hypothetical protein CA222_17610 [Sphingomonas koreensis]RSU23931.1 hypothetical protein CA225_17265 [Sphingomonas koreensis]